MGALKDKLLEEGRRPNVVSDCALLVDSEVDSKTGIGGMVIKTGYKAFKALRPSIVREAVEYLLDDFVEVLDKHYLAFKDSGSPSFERFAVARDKQIANDLLGVTDGIINKSDKTALKKIYQGLRKVAERNVAQAVPAVSRLIEKYMR